MRIPQISHNNDFFFILLTFSTHLPHTYTGLKERAKEQTNAMHLIVVPVPQYEYSMISMSFGVFSFICSFVAATDASDATVLEMDGKQQITKHHLAV